MNHATLLQSPFPLGYPAASDSDFTGTQRQFAGSTGFPTDEDDGSRRVGGLGHPLAQPASMSISNGLRYSAQQSTMHDMPFAASPTILMSPTDSCSDTYSQASGPIYSHSTGIPYERMPDFRSRMPTLQPPTGISPTMQSPGTAVTGPPGIIGRSDGYPSAFALSRNPFPPLTALNDISRFPQYTSTPRTLDNPLDRPQNLIFGHSGNMLVEPGQRLSQSMTDAPPFDETNILHQIVTGNQTINPEIQAKIHKGFFEVEGKWTCYRRNYFSVSCSFTLHPWIHNAPLFIKFPDQGSERIRSFAMSISAIVTAQCGETRELVQHTPKRDKQSERKPGRIPLNPTQPPPLSSQGSVPNSNHLGFGLASHSTGMTMDYNSTYAGVQQPSEPATQHTFERIQFQKATANNGKRRAQQQYYNLVVELHAEIASGANKTQWVQIARKLSHPVVVRGRSPGHYKDGRRDNSTNMGPDGGSGASGNSGRGPLLPPGIAQSTRSHLTLMSYDASQRGGPHYGRPDYHQIITRDQSPLSGSPLMSSSSSPAFDMTIPMDHIDTMKHASSMDSYQDPTLVGTSPGYRKLEGPTSYRNQLSPFEYDSPSKDNGDPGPHFPDTLDPMMPMIQNDQDDPSHFTKRTSKFMPYHHSQSAPGGYDPVFSSRSADSNSYPRFDPISNSQSLCT